MDKKGNRQGRWLIYYNSPSKVGKVQVNMVVKLDEQNIPKVGGEVSEIPDYFAYISEASDINNSNFYEECNYKDNVKNGDFILYRSFLEKDNTQRSIPVIKGKYANGLLNGEVKFIYDIAFEYVETYTGYVLSLNRQSEVKVIYENGKIVDQSYGQEQTGEIYFIFKDGKCIEYSYYSSSALNTLDRFGSVLRIRKLQLDHIPAFMANYFESSGYLKFKPTNYIYHEHFIGVSSSNGFRIYYASANWSSGIMDTARLFMEYDRIRHVLHANDARGRGPIFKYSCDTDGVFNGPAELYYLTQTDSGEKSVLRYKVNYVNGYLDGSFEAYAGGGLPLPVTAFAVRPLHGVKGRFVYPSDFASAEESQGSTLPFLLRIHNSAYSSKKDWGLNYIECKTCKEAIPYGLFYRVNMVPYRVPADDAEEYEGNYGEVVRSYPDQSVSYFFNDKKVANWIIDNNKPTETVDIIIFDELGDERTSLNKIKAGQQIEDQEKERQRQDLLNTEVPCAACNKIVIVRNAKVNDGGCSCIDSNGKRVDVMGSILSVKVKYFCSIRCKMDFERDCCTRNSMRYE